MKKEHEFEIVINRAWFYMVAFKLIKYGVIFYFGLVIGKGL